MNKRKIYVVERICPLCKKMFIYQPYQINVGDSYNNFDGSVTRRNCRFRVDGQMLFLCSKKCRDKIADVTVIHTLL